MALADEKKVMEIVIVRPCVVKDADGKSAVRKRGEKLTVANTDGNFLCACRKAVKAADYRGEPKKEKK